MGKEQFERMLVTLTDEGLRIQREMSAGAGTEGGAAEVVVIDAELKRRDGVQPVKDAFYDSSLDPISPDFDIRSWRQ